ncbi:MAG TPA: DUF397 domain-containing protein [Trebonia sp.]|nr:DUF397 domain-containing protein [Trebonia sp.]
MTGYTGGAVPSQGGGLADGEEAADEAVAPLPRRIPGQASKLWPGRRPGAAMAEPAGPWPDVATRLMSLRAAPGKPTPSDLGIDVAALEWERSGDGEGRMEVAFPSGPASGEATWSRGEWVLMRVTGDPARRVLVFDRNEWECFLDGARNGEFDDAI